VRRETSGEYEVFEKDIQTSIKAAIKTAENPKVLAIG
jgi:hypothetical protein